MNKNQRNRQRGATLVELMMVIALMASLMVLTFSNKSAEIEQRRAQALGNELFLYTNAVRQYIATNRLTITDQSDIKGTSWLKHPDCTTGAGDPDRTGFLPCSFPAGTVDSPFFGGVSLTTDIVIEADPTHPTNEQIRITTTTTPLKLGGQVRQDLSGIAAIAASSGTQIGQAGALVSTYGSFKSNTSTGEITIIVTNGLEGDVWVRTDRPVFKASAIFDPELEGYPDERYIGNVSRLKQMLGEILYLGLEDGQIVTEGSLEIKKDLEVIGNTTIGERLKTNELHITDSVNPDSATSCQPGDILRSETGTIVSCVNGRFHLNTHWERGLVTSGSSCEPGSLGLDSHGNLYICRR